MQAFRGRRPSKESLPVPRDHELLSYLDGELAPERRAEVEQLIASSWDVRRRLRTLEQSLALYINGDQEGLPDGAPPVDEAWHRFKQKLRNADLSSDSPASIPHAVFAAGALTHSNLDRIRSSPWLRIAACAALASGAVGWWLSRSAMPRVQAREVLDHARSAEAASLGSVGNPVMHQRIIARRIADGVESPRFTLEIWNDAGENRFRQVAGMAASQNAVQDTKGGASESETLIELNRVFEKNAIDGRRPLSVSSYDRWRERNGVATEMVGVTSVGTSDSGYTVTTLAGGPARTDKLLSTELFVRSGDWHPTRERLSVQASGGVTDYELEETSYEVLPRNALDPAIFVQSSAPGDQQARLVPGTLANPLNSAIAQVPILASPDLLAAQVDADYVLHQLDACTRDDVTVARDEAHVIIGGVVSTTERRQQILLKLSASRYASVIKDDLSVASDISASAITATPFDATELKDTQGSAIRINSGAPPIELLVAGSQAFDSRRLNQISGQAVSLADQALASAWALRRLSEKYGGQIGGLLPASSQIVLQAMISDHATILLHRSRELQELVGPVLKMVGEAPPASPADRQPRPTIESDWAAVAMEMFQSVRATDKRVHALFASADPGSESASSSAIEISRGLTTLNTNFPDPEVLTHKWFRPRTQDTTTPQKQ